MRKFSHSSLSTWRRCRARYKWLYMDNYAPSSSPGQRKGQAGHSALAEWYKTGDRAKAIKAASATIEGYEQEDGRDHEDEWQILLPVLNRYFDWSAMQDNFTEVIALEQKYELPVGAGILQGYIDGIVVQSSSNWLLEHKFSQKASLQHVALDSQVSTYMFAAHKLGYNPRGTIYNIVRMQEGGIANQAPVLRTKVYRNGEGMPILEYELATQIAELTALHTNPNSAVIYRNPTKDCVWDCPFYSVCLSINDCGDADSILSTMPRKDPEEYGRQDTGTDGE